MRGSLCTQHMLLNNVCTRMIQNKQRTPGTYMSHAASPHSSLSRLSACSQYLRRLTCDVYLYGSEAEVIIRTFIHKYIAYNRHESVDATLPSTIDIWEHFTAINVPLYSYLCVQSYSMRALPWPSPPRTVNFGLPLCDLSITIRRCCRYFSRRIPPPPRDLSTNSIPILNQVNLPTH